MGGGLEFLGGATVTAHSYEPGVGEGGGGPWPGGACVIYLSAANPLGAANHYAHMYQPIEGYQMADALWGTANAKPVVFRFMAMSVQPGTYSMTIMNTAQTHSFYQRFTIVGQNTWEEFVIPVPGCTIGVWPTDHTQWGFACVNGAFTTAYIGGAPGVWNTGMFYTDSAFNAFQGLAGYFRIAKMGLYIDPFATGAAPYWEFPHTPWRSGSACGSGIAVTACAACFPAPTNTNSTSIKHPVPMRIHAIHIHGRHDQHLRRRRGRCLRHLGSPRSNVDVLEMGLCSGDRSVVHRLSGDGAIHERG